MKKIFNNFIKTGLVSSFLLTSTQALATVGDKADIVGSSAESLTTLFLQFAMLCGVGAVIWGLLGFLKNKNGGGSQETAGGNILKMWIGGLLIAVPALILVFTATSGLEAAGTTTSILTGK